MDRRRFLAASFAAIGMTAVGGTPLLSNVRGENKLIAITCFDQVLDMSFGDVHHIKNFSVILTLEELPNGHTAIFSQIDNGDKKIQLVSERVMDWWELGKFREHFKSRGWHILTGRD